MCFIEKVTAIGRVTAIGYRPAIGCDIYCGDVVVEHRSPRYKVFIRREIRR